jgi:hypothetical protein
LPLDPSEPSLEDRYNDFHFITSDIEEAETPPPAKIQPRRPPLEVRILGVDEPITAANLSELYNRLVDFPYFFDDFAKNPYVFQSGVVPPSLVILWGRPAVGFIWLHSVYGYPGNGPQVGYIALATWSIKAWGRVEELRSILRAGMKARNLHRITALICDRNKAAKKLALRLGFRHEGQSRQALCYNGVWEDVGVFGVLKDDMV